MDIYLKKIKTRFIFLKCLRREKVLMVVLGESEVILLHHNKSTINCHFFLSLA